MSEIKFYKHEQIPMEMHKVKIVQQLHLLPADLRLAKMKEAGFNTFQLHNGDIFMDMLTDSGVNAMSDNMQAAMMRADDAYAGSETFYRMQEKLEEIKALLNEKRFNKNQVSTKEYYVKARELISLKLVDTINLSEVYRIKEFFGTSQIGENILKYTLPKIIIRSLVKYIMIAV